MPLVKEIETEIGLLGIWKLSETSEELQKEFQFNHIENIEYSKIKFEKRKTEYLASRLLLQKLLDFKPKIEYKPSGKPILKESPLHISISHSANLVTVLVSEKNVGIDVENTERNVERVARRFLHQNEFIHISTLENPQAVKVLYWSAKEAIFKCTDTVGVEFNEQIFIEPFGIKKEGCFDGTLNGTLRYKLWYFFYENHVIVYCVE